MSFVIPLVIAEMAANVPVAVVLRQCLKPVRIAADGRTFAEPLADWQVGTVTGRVVHVVHRTRATTVHGRYTSSTHVTPYVTLLLEVANHQYQHKVHLVDVGDDIFPGQVVTDCYAWRGRTACTFAILNRSTGESIVVPKGVNRVAGPTEWLGIRAIVLSVLSIAGIWLLVVAQILWKRRLSRFAGEGMAPLWELPAPSEKTP